MPTLPWRAVDHADAPASATVMASMFRLRRPCDVPRFFLDSMRIYRQVLHTDGALGVSLIAHPLRREFFTVSAWRDRSALNDMVRAEPHRSAMRRHHNAMADTGFTFWEVDYADLPVDWHDARRRLERRRIRTRDGRCEPDQTIPTEKARAHE